MYRLFKLLIFLLFFSSTVYSQSAKPGTWGIATLVLPADTSHRLGGYLESQVQTDRLLFNKFYYSGFKTGISYAIDNSYNVLIGTGRYTTYDYTDVDKGPVTTENRIWEQLAYTHNLGRIKFEHRYRIEQRWLNSIFRSRFRYRLNAVVPFNNKKVQAGTLFMSVFDEIFLGNKQFSWERNRMSALLGYQFTPSVIIQSGWMNEDNNSLLSSGEKNNLLINFIYQIHRKKS